MHVLVLNASYEPLNVCTVKRAHVLVFKGKAEVIETLDRPLRSATSTFVWPHVIRLVNYVRVPRTVKRKISRRALFARDGWRCVYCGSTGRLTLDHVVPRSRGAKPRHMGVAPCGKKRAHARRRLGIAGHREQSPQRPRQFRTYTEYTEAVAVLELKSRIFGREFRPKPPNPERVAADHGVVEQYDGARRECASPSLKVVAHRLVGMLAIQMQEVDAAIRKSTARVVEGHLEQR